VADWEPLALLAGLFPPGLCTRFGARQGPISAPEGHEPLAAVHPGWRFLTPAIEGLAAGPRQCRAVGPTAPHGLRPQQGSLIILTLRGVLGPRVGYDQNEDTQRSGAGSNSGPKHRTAPRKR
jgi:hypothetical protein